MHEHQDDTKGSVIVLLDSIREFDLAQVRLKEKEEVDQELVHNSPSLLVLGEKEI